MVIIEVGVQNIQIVRRDANNQRPDDRDAIISVLSIVIALMINVHVHDIHINM